ncbi:MAG TPA: glycine cleavage system protein GcvH [Candidatus Acidoferrum sp.]|nr:glycine cleavage system protein GcvH [Candidatus Acidoferrum sp.]
MKVLANLKYTKEHEWVRLDGKVAAVGITDFAQGELGDIVFVEMPEVGLAVKQMGKFGTIEAVKAVSDMFSPVSGKVVEVNKAIEADPMIINRDPYGEGWIIKVEVSNAKELDQLLDSKAYEQLLKEHH